MVKTQREADVLIAYSRERKAKENAALDLVRYITPKKLTVIRAEFLRRNETMSLEEFVHVMRKHLLNDRSLHGLQDHEYEEFTEKLIELFKEVDVNGDGDLEWDEFTVFISEKVS